MAREIRTYHPAHTRPLWHSEYIGRAHDGLRDTLCCPCGLYTACRPEDVRLCEPCPRMGHDSAVHVVPHGGVLLRPGSHEPCAAQGGCADVRRLHVSYIPLHLWRVMALKQYTRGMALYRLDIPLDIRHKRLRRHEFNGSETDRYNALYHRAMDSDSLLSPRRHSHIPPRQAERQGYGQR